MNTYQETIARKTIGEIQTFINELFFGTSNYKSIHNLNEQMVHDYSNRFLIELIQNSHDALKKPSKDGRIIGKIKIVLLEKPGEVPVLYVANNGNPFSKSNFDALSRFGQSDKDPQSSIGNKGIGFRSVLQICSNPHIYSGSWESGKGFSGFCFKFDPDSKNDLRNQVLDCIVVPGKEKIALFGIDEDIFIGNTSKKRIFEKNILPLCKERKISLKEYVFQEYEYLSPYLLPIPLDEKPSDEVIGMLGKEGFVTIVKLELNQENALYNVKKAIEEFNNSSSIIFLDRLGELIIENRGKIKENLESHLIKTINESEDFRGILVKRIKIFDKLKNNEKKWWVWSKECCKNSKEKQKKLGEFVSELPGKWKGLKEVKIEIAIPVSESPIQGLIFIFLPTRQPNGFFYHINAPFFGDINRKSINLEKPYNKFLLSLVGALVYDVASYLKEKTPKYCEDMIIDLISLKGSDEDVIEIVLESLENKLKECSLDLSEWEIIPYQNSLAELDFGSLKNVFSIPLDWNFQIFSRENLVFNIGEKILSGVSETRFEGLSDLADYVGLYMEPKEIDIVLWIEKMGEFLKIKRANSKKWALFYEEIIVLVEDPKSLLGKRILLCEDGYLNIAGDTDKILIFFRPDPPVGEKERENEDNDSSKIRIPSFLQKKIAFFSSPIFYGQIDEMKKQNLLSFLSGSDPPLVQTFNIETILEKVILPQMSENPIKYDTKKSKKLWELFLWAMQLFQNFPRELRPFRELFGKILVPCKGGWYPANQAYFSKDWDGLHNVKGAKVLSEFFNDGKAGKCKTLIIKQVFGKNNLEWKKNLKAHSDFEKIAEFLFFCGVVDYLRIFSIKEKITINGWFRGLEIYEKPEFLFTDEEFDLFRDFIQKIKVPYQQSFQYEIQGFFLIEGFLGRYQNLSQRGKLLFSKLIVSSIGNWSSEWKTSYIIKKSGKYWSKGIDSFLKFLLENLAWVPTGTEKEGIFNSPRKCWFIPTSELLPYLYSFLPYVEANLTKEIEEKKEGMDNLISIGLSPINFRNIEDGFKLVNDFAEIYENEKVAPEQMNFFQNQYRFTWGAIEEIYNKEGFDKKIKRPEKILVTEGKGSIKVFRISELDLSNNETKIYVPNDKELYNRLKENSFIKIFMIEPGKKYVKMLNEFFEDKLELISDLKQEIRIDKKKWTKVDNHKNSSLFFEVAGEWLLVFITCIATFRENSNIFLGKKRFKEIVALFRRSKYQECLEIETVLLSGDGKRIDSKFEEVTINQQIGTFFVKKSNALSYEKFAKPISEYLDMPALEVPLAFSLSKINGFFGGEEPGKNVIEEALSALHISPENYFETKKNIHSTLDWLVERLYPVMVTFSEGVDPKEIKINEISNEEMLREFLKQNIPDHISIDYLIQISQETKNDFEMGRRLYYDFQVTLKQWNIALGKIGREKVICMELDDSFNVFKQKFRKSIMAILREKARSSGNKKDYIKNKEDFEKLGYPLEWNEMFWEIELEEGIKIIIRWLNGLEIGVRLLSCFKNFGKADKIVNCIQGFLPDACFTTEEIRKKNYDLFLDIFGEIHRVLIAALNKRGIPIPIDLNFSSEDLVNKFIKGKEEEFEIEEFNERKVIFWLYGFSLFREIAECLELDLNKIGSLKEMSSFLEIFEEDINNADEFLKKSFDEDIRKRRTVLIKGKNFDADEKNLRGLHEILEREIGFSLNMQGSIEEPLILKPNRRRLSGERRGGLGVRSRKPKKNVENAIGYAGEIFVFESLKTKYVKSFTADCWKSENSTIYFPGKNGDDSLGFDFEFFHKKRKFLIEVKATMGHDYEFEMGYSEIRAAMEETKNTEYRIAFVTRVFDDPEILWLPNPFSQEGKDVFFIKGSGSRLSFKI